MYAFVSVLPGTEDGPACASLVLRAEDKRGRCGKAGDRRGFKEMPATEGVNTIEVLHMSKRYQSRSIDNSGLNGEKRSPGLPEGQTAPFLALLLARFSWLQNREGAIVG